MGVRATFPAVLAAALVLGLAAAPAHARRAEDGTPAVRLTREAERGLDLAWRRWQWRGWLVTRPGNDNWAPMWHTIHLVMAAEGVAAATGRPSDVRRAAGLARRAEGYWNPELGGYAGGYATRGSSKPAWFDDNGWLGLAFFSAYRETHDRRFLRDAQRAFAFVLRDGWDPRGGGIWWSNARDFKSGESVVTTALLAVRLHAATGDPSYLLAARHVLDWTDRHLLDRRSGLYVNRPGGGPVSYLQSPMLDAFARLCRHEGLYCRRVQPLLDATLRRYGGDLAHAPQYDAMYLRFLVDTREVLGDTRLGAVVLRNAERAERRARGRSGLYERDWSGGGREVQPGGLQTHAATVEALAWAAAVAARS